MSTPPPSAAPPRRARTTSRKAKKSIWAMELGKKSSDDDVEHPPFVPTLPRVNLLPPAVHEGFVLRRVRRAFVAVAVVLAMAFGAVWYLQGNQIAEAEAALALAESENVTMTHRVEALAPVKQMYVQITGQQELVRASLASQPQAAVVVSHLLEAAAKASRPGAQMDFSNVTISYRGLSQLAEQPNPCPNPDPFSEEVAIGCLAFDATARNREQVADVLRLLEDDPFFVGPYVDSSTMTARNEDAPQTVTFSGTAGVSVDALTTALTAEELELLVNPPAPEPTDEETQDEEAAS